MNQSLPPFFPLTRSTVREYKAQIRYWVLSIYQIDETRLFIDCGKSGRILDIDTFEQVHQFFTGVPIRCVRKADNLFIVCIDNGKILIFDIKDNFKLLLALDNGSQARSLAFRDNVLVLSQFKHSFMTYLTND